MKEISFSSSIQYTDKLSFTQKMYNFVEDYFNFGKIVYTVKPNVLQNGGHVVMPRKLNQSKLEQVMRGIMKILSLLTIIIPLIILTAKAHHRLSNKFYLTAPNEKLAKPNPATDKPTAKPKPEVSHPDPKEPASLPEPIGLKQVISEVKEINGKFTTNFSVTDQITAHEKAKKFLELHLPKTGAEIQFVSPDKIKCPSVKDVVDFKKLDSNVFTWSKTSGVGQEIQRDGKRDEKVIIVHSGASQFNGCEAPKRGTVKPGKAVGVYKDDGTQGPEVQLQFCDDQVELINCGGNIGFNSLIKILDKFTQNAVEHGYLTPDENQAARLIEQLRTKGENIEYICVSNVPVSGKEKVHMFLVAAPAFGMYTKINTVKKGPLRNEIEFLCALLAFRAQFKHCVNLALTHKLPVILKAAGIGLGVFNNNSENVLKAFYQAATEYENQLRDASVSVQFQVFMGTGKAKEIANKLKLKERATAKK